MAVGFLFVSDFLRVVRMFCPVSPTVSVADEACAEVNGLKASRFFSMAEKLNVGSEPFIWLFIRPPWSVSGSCCKAVVHDSLRAECQLQRVSHGKAQIESQNGGKPEVDSGAG